MMRFDDLTPPRAGSSWWGHHARPQQAWCSSSTDTHDDFKPRRSAPGAPLSVMDVIKADVTSHDVMLYMKVLLLRDLRGSPMPPCLVPGPARVAREPQLIAAVCR